MNILIESEELCEELCEFCGGTGRIERVEFQRDETTGYNTIEYATGVFDKCPMCNPEFEE